MRHLLSIRHLETAQIQALVDMAALYKQRVLQKLPIEGIEPKMIGLLFFEGSTRTRVSFEQAAYYLGYRTTSFGSEGSSMSKGETLKDTILTLRYERLEGLVMRHRASGSAQLASTFFGSPVINAGDGQHEHPTQALGDALTILERKGRIEGLRVAIVGDVLHSRVARSNAWLLSKLGAEIRFVGPRTLMPPQASLLPGTVHNNIAGGIADADVVMCLRLQRERMMEGLLSSVSEYARMYQVNQTTLRYAKKDCLVMHPGPINRGVEVDDLAADGASSAIRQQVENGIFVRMAALSWIFGNEPPAPPRTVTPKAAKKVKPASGGKKK